MIDTVFNQHKHRLITLREGEEFCEKCRGEGVVVLRGNLLSLFAKKYLTCSGCQGDGKIDWIERVTGKPKTVYKGTGFSIGPGRP